MRGSHCKIKKCSECFPFLKQPRLKTHPEVVKNTFQKGGIVLVCIKQTKQLRRLLKALKKKRVETRY